MSRRGVGRWMFLLVPAHPGSPIQSAVKWSCVCVRAIPFNIAIIVLLLISFYLAYFCWIVEGFHNGILERMIRKGQMSLHSGKYQSAANAYCQHCS